MAKYDYDTKALIGFFLDAQLQTRKVLASLYTQDETLTRAMLVARQEQIDAIIKQLETEGVKWAEQAIDRAALEGVAESLVSLGLATDFSEALGVASFSQANQAYVMAQIADTQKDILAVTQNMNREAKALISQAYASELRTQLLSGNNSIRGTKNAVQQAIRKEMNERINSAIVDKAGRTWKLENYVDMLVKTKAMKAHREASINSGLEEGTQYARISTHGAKDACSRWEGKIVKLDPKADGDYPYIDDLPRREIFHPRCKHILSPIFLD